MYISAFHIDGFGIFANVDCENLSPGLNIFYGKNEAGKSTCLEFFRAMLTGYASGNRRRQVPAGRENAHQGGTLFLECEKAPHEVRLVRSPANLGGLRLYAADGSSLSGDTLARILSGVNREIYSRIFGFSLSELEQWDKASDASIRNALYGASFGPGLNSPIEAEKNLQKKMEAIFKAGGSKQPLVAKSQELKRIQLEISSLKARNAEYDAKAAELAAATADLEKIRAGQADLGNERRELERRLDQWRNRDLLREEEARLAAMETVPESFPEDAVRQLEDLRSASSRAERDLAQARVKLGQLEERLSALSINGILIAELAELRRLAERKNSYRQARKQVKSLEEQRDAFQERLDQDLAQLGPDWTCDRIRKTDRSLFARDGMDKLASALKEAKLAHDTLAVDLRKANSQVERIGAKAGELEAQIAELPSVAAIMDDREREELRESRLALEECRRNEPRRMRTWEEAKHAFGRALAQAQVFGNQESGADDSGRLMGTLLEHQEEASGLAARLDECLRDAQKAMAEEREAEKETEEIRARLESEISAQRGMGGPSRDALDAKAQALKSLRDLAGRIAAEDERKNEIDARISQERQAAPLRNWTLVTFAILFLCGAAAIFVAHWFYGLQELRLAEGVAIPVNLWAAYAALVCGVVLFASGFSAYGPEQKRRKRELESLLARSQTCAMRIAELGEQARRLRKTLDLDDMDPISLDAMEMLLEREREQYYNGENAKRAIARLEREKSLAGEKLGRHHEATREKDMLVQQMRKRWHSFMLGLGVANVPSPESINAVFARLEIAKLAEQNMIAAQKELDALWEDLHLLEQQISNMPAIQEILNSAPEPMSLEEAIETALARCSDADRVLARRNSLKQELDSCQKDLEEAESSQKEAEEALKLSSASLATARDNWDSWVNGLGLAPDMAPETVRQAYDCMQACLGDEENLGRAEKDLAHCNEEIAAFEKPLASLIKRAGAEPCADADGACDWLASFDRLMEEAEAGARRQQLREARAEEIAAQKDEIAILEAGASTCLANISELVKRAGASDENHLLRLARTRDERRAAHARIRDLRLTLAQAAGDKSLEQFLAAFDQGDQESQNARLAEIGRLEKELRANENRQIGREAILKQELAALEADTELHEKRQKEEMLQEEIAVLADSWRELALADALLKEAKSSFEKERQPEIIRIASDIFREITDGRWSGISLKLDDGSLAILPAHGDPVLPEELSRGGQEQAWLSLRLAYITRHNESAEPLPLIMDEVLVNFDPERAKRSARAFARLAQTGRQQIMYFTCQPHMVEILTAVFEKPALYNVADGRIAAA